MTKRKKSKAEYIPTTDAIEAGGILDSRDVIARIGDLEGADDENPLSADDAAELAALQALASEGEGYGDWSHGEALIPEDEFTEHIKQLVADCYQLPKEFDSGTWPWNHMTMDWDAAADEAKAAYIELTYQGTTYLMRS